MSISLPAISAVILAACGRKLIAPSALWPIRWGDHGSIQSSSRGFQFLLTFPHTRYIWTLFIPKTGKNVRMGQPIRSILSYTF